MNNGRQPGRWLAVAGSRSGRLPKTQSHRPPSPPENPRERRMEKAPACRAGACGLRAYAFFSTCGRAKTKAGAGREPTTFSSPVVASFSVTGTFVKTRIAFSPFLTR